MLDRHLIFDFKTHHMPFFNTLEASYNIRCNILRAAIFFLYSE